MGSAPPLPLALWSLILRLGGSWPILHVVNIGYHAASVALLTWLGQQIFGARLPGLVMGVAFATYPANFEVVAWTAGVFDSMATLAIVAAAASFVTMTDWRGATLAVAVLTVIGLLSKETTVILPALLICLAPLAARPGGKWALNWGMPIVVAAAIVGIYVAVRHASAGDHLAAAVPITRWQLKNLLVRPYAALVLPFHADVPMALPLVAALAVVLLFWAAAYVAKAPEDRSASAAMAGGLTWTLLAALPLLGSFYVGPDLQGSRYAYLPLVGFSLAIAGAVKALHDSGAAWFGRAAFVCLLATWLWSWPSHVAAWQSASTLRDRVLAEAQSLKEMRGCSSLQINAVPDNFRGAYVFRVGLDAALGTLIYRPDGTPCVAEWQDASQRLSQ